MRQRRVLTGVTDQRDVYFAPLYSNLAAIFENLMELTMQTQLFILEPFSDGGKLQDEAHRFKMQEPGYPSTTRR